MNKKLIIFFIYIFKLIYKFKYKIRYIIYFLFQKNYNNYKLIKININNGFWPYGINYGIFKNHSYFGPNFFQKELALSLLNSSGSDICLGAVFLPAAIVRVHWSGREIYSLNHMIDSEFSMGLQKFANKDDKNAHIYFVTNSHIFCQRNSNNYYHFFAEVLPTIISWKKNNCLTGPLVLFDAKFVTPALRACGIDNSLVLIPSNSILICRNSHVSQIMPAGYLAPKLLQDIQLATLDAAEIAIEQQLPRSKHIFLNRLNSEGRTLINESATIRLLQEYYPDLLVVYPGRLSFLDQVDLMREAELVVSIHGAQTTNMLWAKKLRLFIEITSFPENVDFTNLARILGCEARQINSVPEDAGNLWTSHECDLTQLRKTLSEIVGRSALQMDHMATNGIQIFPGN